MNNVSKKLKIEQCIFSFFFKKLVRVTILIFMPDQKIGLSDIRYHPLYINTVSAHKLFDVRIQF